MVHKFHIQGEEIKQKKESDKLLNARITEKGAALSEVRAKFEAQRALLDELSAKLDQSKDSVPEIKKKGDTLREEINAKYSELKQVHADHKKFDSMM